MRTFKSIKNITYAVGGQILNLLLNFVNRTVFINVLGITYLGVNGLFSNILTMLSLAELGVGSAIIYSMYGPLANKDERKMKALMDLYSTAYKIIGTVVFIIGVSLLPFLDLIIKDKPDVPNLELIYMLFVLNSSVTYFFSYKRSIIIADQKGYINTTNQYTFLVLLNITQIIVLLITKSFIFYLVLTIVFNLISNISISLIANKLYPYLTKRERIPLDKQEKRTITNNVMAMMSHKVGGIVVNGTDNILISTFIGLYWVGVYSNYYMIITMVTSVLGLIFSSILSSVGNLSATEGKEKLNEVYNKVLFMNAWIYGFCSISVLLLINHFIVLWIGDEYIFDNILVYIIVINFFLNGMRQSTTTFNTALGLFWNDRFKPWFEAAINLAASLILLKEFGIIGVFLGTLISTLTTSFWVEPYILYKHGFKIRLFNYFKLYSKYLFVTIIAGLITFYFASFVPSLTWLSLLVKILICIVVVNLVFIFCFFNTPEFNYFSNLFKKIITKQN